MAKIKGIVVPDSSAPDGFSPNGDYSFKCPGCGEYHVIPTTGPNAWGFNGNVDRPTFTPSILVRSGHFDPYFDVSGHCWCQYNMIKIANGEEPSSFTCYVCHSSVTDGKIQFLRDCTHHLAGKTVELPEIE